MKLIKKLSFLLIRFFTFKVLTFRNLYINRFIKEYYTKYVYEKSLSIGLNVKVNGKIKVTNFRGLNIGNNVHIGENAFFYTEGGLVIGDNTHISRNVTIYTANHNYEGEGLPYDHTYNTKPVIIEKNVWIGMNVSIAPGVRISEGAIIGMGAVITKNVTPCTVVVNDSTTYLKSRDNELYNTLKSGNKIGGPSGLPVETQNNVLPLPIIQSEHQVFVISTGRAGSQSIAYILSQHPTIKAKHEPNWPLIKASTEYEYGIINKDEIKLLLNDLYGLSSTLEKNEIYIESDQKIGNLIQIYQEVFPNAKFIWMIRDPFKFVKSAYTRGWFREENKFTQSGRLLLDPMYSSRACRVQGNFTKDVSDDKWNIMDSFERCCWYWSYWNRRIENQLKDIDSNKWLLVDIDNLSNELETIKTFIGIDNFDFKSEKRNIAHKKYRGKYNSFKFSLEQKEMIEKYCLEDYERWTYK